MGRSRLPLTVALVLVVGVQAVCTLFFVSDILAGVVGVEREPLAWETRELMEIGASVGLIIGVALGAVLLVRTLSHSHAMEDRLREVSGAFSDLLEERFREWALTPAERDVAWFTIKGLSIKERAAVRVAAGKLYVGAEDAWTQGSPAGCRFNVSTDLEVGKTPVRLAVGESVEIPTGIGPFRIILAGVPDGETCVVDIMRPR